MKMAKILSGIIVAVMLLVTISNFAYAIDPTEIKPVSGQESESAIKEVGGKILRVVQVVGSVLSVVILAVLGIKYMMGSTEEKAEYKKTLMPYVIGAVLIFGASNIASMVFKAASTL